MFIKTTKFYTLLLGIGAVSFLQAQYSPVPGPDFSDKRLNERKPAMAAHIAEVLQGPNVIISNGKLTKGSIDQVRSFTYGRRANLEMDKGVGFFTGLVNNILSISNIFEHSDGLEGEDPDEDLITIEPLARNDTSAYEFDVYIADPAKNQLNIAYQFGSEEYPRFVGSKYNDAFAFFISGPGIGNGTTDKINMAKFLNTEVNPPVEVETSVNTINSGIYGWGQGEEYPIERRIDGRQKNYYINNGHTEETQPFPRLGGEQYIELNEVVNNNAKIGVQFNGMTKKIHYSLKGLQAGQTYKLKIVIADAGEGDTSLDSGVFVENINATINLKANDDTYEMTAGSTTANSIITNDTANDTEAVKMEWLTPLTPFNIVKVTSEGKTPITTGFSINSEGKVVADNNVEAGTYEFNYNLCDASVGDFCSTAKVTVVVTGNTTPPQGQCYKPGNLTGQGEPTKFGISTVGQPNDGWPENVPSGHIVMESRDKGFVITQVANTSAITNPVEGMLVYDLTDNCVKLYNGSVWKCLEKNCD